MWRSMFIALGIFLCLVGGEFLACDHLVLRSAMRDPQPEPLVKSASFAQPVAAPAERKIYVPRDWMPWTLLASGAVVLMYSLRARE
ncbi:MAG: hypothetical protein Q8M16_14500 [Pirellulaceae bacterium]|nr:hypothetical protein [Pirellulaceae bacterium]